ncbi:hypothetical protein FJW07_21355 [Mesorhizobium sp. B3-1-9]|uniref:hypothetical protein n=1 Tax=unclassified Mesorhizobium TaxID=325217 RepID=UPI00112CDEED|nr:MULTISPECIES: hypothetical protein [unclassified Mesorhizobium]TPI35637.1 hypothetical protein FJ414_18360 [Mesorhizobium sp. B3-1-6]TPI36200.1 hypothetical protein FJW07_21355 [Mesorhizobium sp. B3-1-9]TPI64537.1 hypothetical protein FJ417_02595 [Mesorhizobium sp. B3-1-7]TPI66205.1 hypothetical protein FJ424_13235 [Mesorhizobium sp. B3-1-8]TPI73257.1 hypothetical protein FJ420_09950 [Mesorhizobium sp. B3-1-3]
MADFNLSRRDSLRNIVALGVAGAAVAVGATALAATEAEAAGQPHMSRALAALETALNQLQVAIPDKGGHRLKAIALVRDAIDETTKGMAVGAM